MATIFGHDLLDDVSSMVERICPTTADEFVGVGLEMLVLMEPSMNVVLLLGVEIQMYQ